MERVEEVGTQTISQISLTNLANEISYKNCYHRVLTLSRKKWNGSHIFFVILESG